MRKALTADLENIETPPSGGTNTPCACDNVERRKDESFPKQNLE
jgi:hypothetical protein